MKQTFIFFATFLLFSFSVQAGKPKRHSGHYKSKPALQAELDTTKTQLAQAIKNYEAAEIALKALTSKNEEEIDNRCAQRIMALRSSARTALLKDLQTENPTKRLKKPASSHKEFTEFVSSLPTQSESIQPADTTQSASWMSTLTFGYLG